MERYLFPIDDKGFCELTPDGWICPPDSSSTHIHTGPDLAYNLPEGVNMALVTGKSQRPAPVAVQALAATFGGAIAEPADALPTPATPSLADDVAALRAGIVRELGHLDGAGLLLTLDRIAAQVPQRAMGKGILSRPLWQHETCRHIDDVTPGPGLTHCNGCGMATDKWQALYTLSSQ